MVTKLLTGIGTTGVVAGAITGVYLYNKPKAEKTSTIADLIKIHGTGKTFLNSTTKSTGDWKAIWEKYRTANASRGQSKGNDKWKLEDWATQHNNTSSLPESFVVLCTSKVNTRVTGMQDENYTDFINWCSR